MNVASMISIPEIERIRSDYHVIKSVDSPNNSGNK